jgi:hypothetical protein
MAGRRFDVLAMTAAEKSELTAMASRPKTAQASRAASSPRPTSARRGKNAYQAICAVLDGESVIQPG